MADIAQIGFRADTSELKDAKTDLNALVPAAKNAERAADTFSSRVAKAGDTLSGKFVSGVGLAKTALVGLAAGMLGAFAGGALLASLGATADRIDDISKAASKLKVNMGDLQGLAYAADLAGVSFDQLSTVAQKMNRVIGQAIAKGKENEGVFKLLGISAKTLSDLPIDKRFAAIADQMNSMNLTADQTALILGQLGDRSGSLTALFEGGSDAINEASEALDRFNGKLTNSQGLEVEAMNDAFTSLGYAIQAAGNQFVAFIAPYIAPAINAVAEAIGWINRQLTQGGTAAAVFKAAMGGILSAFNPIIAGAVALGRVFSQVFGVSLGTAVKTGANFIINGFSGAFQAVAIIWGRLPSIFAAAAYGAAKMALDGVNNFVQGAIQAFANLATAVAGMFGVEVGKFDAASVVDLKTTDLYKSISARSTSASADAKGGFTEAADAFNAQMNVDNFATSTDNTTEAATKATPALTDFGGALDTAGKAAGGATEKLTELQRIGQELDKLGAPFDQAKSAFDKLGELQKNGIITGDQYTSMLERIRQAFISTGGTAEQWSKVIATKTNDMTTALKDFSSGALTSMGDTLADLVVDGKADFKALADGIIKDLIRMMWQMLVVKPLMGSLFGFESGGAFGGGGMLGFANGGTFTNKIYSSPTPFKFAAGGGFASGVMGEAGPEAVMPLKRGPNGSLGVEAHGLNGKGGGGGGGNVIMGDVHITQQSSGDSQKDRAHAAETARQVEESMERVALKVVQRERNYGGSLNPRGAR